MPEEDILDLSKYIGDRCRRAYSGSPDDYNFKSVMPFSLLTVCGLRQAHKLLGIRCAQLMMVFVLEADAECDGAGRVYSERAEYRLSTVLELAIKQCLKFEALT